MLPLIPPLRSKYIFLFGVELFLEGDWCAGKKQEVTKAVSLVNIACVSSPHNVSARSVIYPYIWHIYCADLDYTVQKKI